MARERPSYGREGTAPGGGGVLDAVVVLLVCLALGLVGRNPLIVAASAALLLLTLGRMGTLIQWVGQHGTTVGVFLLIVSLMAPVAAGQLSLAGFTGELLRPSGLIAVGVAAAAAYFGRGGVQFLQSYPAALVGLIVGSVLGTIVLRGVPTGPLIASGITALLLDMFHLR